MRLQERLGATDERVVGLAAHVRPDAHVDDDGEDQNDRRHPGRDDERDTPAQAHGSRSTYPTECTVWISRRAPAVSSLRRR